MSLEARVVQAGHASVAGLGLVMAWRSLRFLAVHACASGDVARYQRQCGKWAVVTGASEGIGLAFATRLAELGFNIALVSLADQHITRAAEALRKKFPKVTIRPIGFDFSNPDAVHYEAHLFRHLSDVREEIAVLVNNVGINYRFPHYYEEVADASKDAAIVHVNCVAQVRMTKYVLPHMKRKKAGAIVSMSSLFGFLPGPLLATYSATKQFNAQFSRSLAVEVAGHGIDVIAVAPAFVATRMSKRKPGMLVDTPDALARASLNQLGAWNYTSGTMTQNLIGTVFNVLPEAALRRLVFDSNAGVRAQGLAKQRKAKL